jgi:hypothetical protein
MQSHCDATVLRDRWCTVLALDRLDALRGCVGQIRRLSRRKRPARQIPRRPIARSSCPGEIGAAQRSHGGGGPTRGRAQLRERGPLARLLLRCAANRWANCGCLSSSVLSSRAVLASLRISVVRTKFIAQGRHGMCPGARMWQARITPAWVCPGP